MGSPLAAAGVHAEWHAYGCRDIKKRWQEKGAAAAAAGTWTHAQCERIPNAGYAAGDGAISCLLNEWVIWEEEGLAGCIDFAALDARGNLVLYDWKRTKKLEMFNMCELFFDFKVPGFKLFSLLAMFVPNSRMLWVTISLCRGWGMLQLTGRGWENFGGLARNFLRSRKWGYRKDFAVGLHSWVNHNKITLGGGRPYRPYST